MKKYTKVRNHRNFLEFENPGEKNSGISKTVPDQSMSIRELMERYAKGLPLGASERIPLYDEDENDVTPDLAHMDLVDQANYLEARYGKLQENLKAIQVAKEKLRLDNLIDSEIKKRGLVSKGGEADSGAPLGDSTLKNSG